MKIWIGDERKINRALHLLSEKTGVEVTDLECLQRIIRITERHLQNLKLPKKERNGLLIHFHSFHRESGKLARFGFHYVLMRGCKKYYLIKCRKVMIKSQDHIEFTPRQKKIILSKYWKYLTEI